MLGGMAATGDLLGLGESEPAADLVPRSAGGARQSLKDFYSDDGGGAAHQPPPPPPGDDDDDPFAAFGIAVV